MRSLYVRNKSVNSSSVEHIGKIPIMFAVRIWGECKVYGSGKALGGETWSLVEELCWTRRALRNKRIRKKLLSEGYYSPFSKDNVLRYETSSSLHFLGYETQRRCYLSTHISQVISMIIAALEKFFMWKMYVHLSIIFDVGSREASVQLFCFWCRFNMASWNF